MLEMLILSPMVTWYISASFVVVVVATHIVNSDLVRSALFD